MKNNKIELPIELVGKIGNYLLTQPLGVVREMYNELEKEVNKYNSINSVETEKEIEHFEG